MRRPEPRGVDRERSSGDVVLSPQRFGVGVSEGRECGVGKRGVGVKCVQQVLSIEFNV